MLYSHIGVASALCVLMVMGNAGGLECGDELQAQIPALFLCIVLSERETQSVPGSLRAKIRYVM